MFCWIAFIVDIKHFNISIDENSKSYVLFSVISDIIRQGLHLDTLTNVDVLGPYAIPRIDFNCITVLLCQLDLLYKIKNKIHDHK